MEWQSKEYTTGGGLYSSICTCSDVFACTRSLIESVCTFSWLNAVVHGCVLLFPVLGGVVCGFVLLSAAVCNAMFGCVQLYADCGTHIALCVVTQIFLWILQQLYEYSMYSH